jgi:hypothetical protein
MRYSSRRDGTAMNTKITAGMIVQATSIIYPSNINRLMFLLKVSVISMYATTVIQFNSIRIYLHANLTARWPITK